MSRKKVEYEVTGTWRTGREFRSSYERYCDAERHFAKLTRHESIQRVVLTRLETHTEEIVEKEHRA